MNSVVLFGKLSHHCPCSFSWILRQKGKDYTREDVGTGWPGNYDQVPYPMGDPSPHVKNGLYLLGWGISNAFSFKGRRVNIFGFVSYMDHTQLCHLQVITNSLRQ